MAEFSTAHEPLSLEDFQRMLVAGITTRPESVGEWVVHCDSMLKPFETASDEAISRLVKSTPDGTGNADWLGEMKDAYAMNSSSSPLMTWVGLTEDLKHDDLVRSMSLIERIFRVLIRTGCATSTALNMTVKAESGVAYPVLHVALLSVAEYSTAVKLLLAEPNIRVTLPRCRCVVDVNTGKRCNALASERSFPHTTLSCAARAREDSHVFELVKRRFGTQLITEEYTYAEFGACNGTHEGPRDEGSTVTLDNPLHSVYLGIDERGNPGDDEVGNWLAERLPSTRLNRLSAYPRDPTPLYLAMKNGMLRTTEALLSRVPDCNLHLKFRPDSNHLITTIAEMVNSDRFEFPRVPESMIADLRAKAKTFGPNYHTSAAALVVQILGGARLQVMPRELLRLVLQYTELPQPDGWALASTQAPGSATVMAAAAVTMPTATPPSASAAVEIRHQLPLLTGRKRKR